MQWCLGKLFVSTWTGSHGLIAMEVQCDLQLLVLTPPGGA